MPYNAATRRPITIPLTLAMLTLAMGACEDEITGPGDEVVEGEVTLDATNPAVFTYMTFSDGGAEITVGDPSTSTEWDIAFRRFSVKLNGGVAGPGEVSGANLENNADATAEEVVAFTVADGEAAFDAVTEADIAGVTFVEEGLVEDLTGPWFRFDPIAGTLVANTGAAWKVRESDGGYSLFRISQLVMAGDNPQSITVELRHQDAGGSLGDAQTVEVDLTMGPGFVDLGSAATVAPAGCNWDVTLTPFFTIDFNEPCDAGTFPLDATEDFTALEQADDAPEYGPFLSVISGGIPSTVEDATGVFWYNIEGANRLWPTYNVFLVRDGTDIYKVQITDFYDAGGTSGFPTVRFEQLR
jgi:hypothetical protein